MSEEDIDSGRRRFLRNATTVIGGAGVAATTIPFLSAWAPSAQALADGAPVEADISKLEPGAMMTIEWRGRPVWIVRRNSQVLSDLKENTEVLRDPGSNVEQQPGYAQNHHRSINPEYLVLVGLCTHLGCSPIYRPDVGGLSADWPGGFYCPCHGSKFDLAGRVFSGVPAPVNMEVPPHYFASSSKIVIGEHGENA